MSGNHEVVEAPQRRHMQTFHGEVPRVGEHFKHLGDWYRVVNVLWETNTGSESCATVVVERDLPPYRWA